jgi:hypothetical protein
LPAHARRTEESVCDLRGPSPEEPGDDKLVMPPSSKRNDAQTPAPVQLVAFVQAGSLFHAPSSQR